MCSELDFNFNPDYIPPVYIRENYTKMDYISDSIKGIIEPVIKYINQPLTKSQNSVSKDKNIIMQQILLSTIKCDYPIFKYLTISQKEAAAFLCGVLLLSESHEFRNPTGGKFERKAMQNVLRLAKNGCTNPFSKVFSNAKGRYIPAHDEKSLKNKNGVKLSTAGGIKQTKNIFMKIKNIDQLNRNSFLKQFLISAGKYFKDKNQKKYTTILNQICSNTDNIKVLNDSPSSQGLELKKVPFEVNEIFKAALKLKKLTIKHENKSEEILDIKDLPNLQFLKVEIIDKFRNEVLRNKKLTNKLMNDSV